jgi:hypothetical protein
MPFELPDPTPTRCTACGGEVFQTTGFGNGLFTFHKETREFLCPEPTEEKK